MPGLFLLFFANRTSPYIERRNEIWEKLYLKELAKFILMGGYSRFNSVAYDCLNSTYRRHF